MAVAPSYCFGAKEPPRNRCRIKGVNQRGRKGFQNSVFPEAGNGIAACK